MMKSSVGAWAAGLFVVVSSCLAMGCDDHEHYYGYGHGPGYGPQSWSGLIRFEWSLGGSSSGNDEDAGAIESDAGVEADAGAAHGVSQHACEALGASEFQALLLDQGSIVGAIQARCGAGAETVRVRANDYTATAALVTQDGVPVTDTEVVPSFVVAPGETQVIRISFKQLAGAE